MTYADNYELLLLAERTKADSVTIEVDPGEFRLPVSEAIDYFDEIAPGDCLVVLHEGRVRATGESAAIAARYGKGDLRAAFAALAADDGARAA